jgi:hypothetical protein
MFLSGPRPLGYPSKGYRTVFYAMALLNRAGVSRRQSTHLAPQQTRAAACEFQDRHRYLKEPRPGLRDRGSREKGRARSLRPAYRRLSRRFAAFVWDTLAATTARMRRCLDKTSRAPASRPKCARRIADERLGCTDQGAGSGGRVLFLSQIKVLTTRDFLLLKPSAAPQM